MAGGFSESSGSGFRIGNAEREAAAAELREHYASGRLTLEELNERLDAALAARTREDLDALMTDLPSARPFPGTGWNAAGEGAGRYAGAGRGTAGGPGAGRRTGQAAALLLWAALAICALLTLGILGAFGVGVGRPFGIVLIVAALAFLRRLLFGRRARARACGPRRRW